MSHEEMAILPALICHVGPCPECGRHIREPFSRFSGPVAHRHGRCRLVVIPAERGERHQVLPVPHGMTLERALFLELRKVLEAAKGKAPAA